MIEREVDCPLCGAEMTVGLGVDVADPNVGIMSDGFWGVVVEQLCKCKPTEQSLDAMSEDYFTGLEADV
jgi:hypothetical protein